LACGKPVVASLVGEVRNMAGGCAVLVKEGNSYSLAEGVLMLLRDEKLRRLLGNSARTRVEKMYNWNYTADSLLRAYERILR